LCTAAGLRITAQRVGAQARRASNELRRDIMERRVVTDHLLDDRRGPPVREPTAWVSTHPPGGRQSMSTAVLRGRNPGVGLKTYGERRMLVQRRFNSVSTLGSRGNAG